MDSPEITQAVDALRHRLAPGTRVIAQKSLRTTQHEIPQLPLPDEVT